MVLREHLAVAELRGTLVYGLNLRTIAQRVGLSLSTVSQAHKRLKEQGWLKVATANLRYLEGRSTQWRLCLPKCTVSEQRNTEGPLTPSHCLILCSEMHHSDLDVGVASDLWRGRRGLGKGRQRIYSLLSRGNGTIDGLVRETGFHRTTVYRALQMLARYNLAKRDGKVWWLGPADVDEVARLLGLAGQAARQRRCHQQEREAFRKWLTARDNRLLVDHETGEVLEPLGDLVAYALRRIGSRVEVCESPCESAGTGNGGPPNTSTTCLRLAGARRWG